MALIWPEDFYNIPCCRGGLEHYVGMELVLVGVIFATVYLWRYRGLIQSR